MTTGAKKLSDLPANALKYLKRLEEVVEVPIKLISVGPERTQTIVK